MTCRLLWIVPLLVLLAGTGCDEPSPPGSSPPLRCTRDPEALAARPLCVDDERCPCGSHCELGRCEADCLADEDCESDEVCDGLGRCRGAGESALLPVPAPTARGGAIRLDQPQVVVAESGEGTLRFAVEHVETSRVRVLGDGPVEVACSEGDWAEECELTDLAAGRLVEVAVRRAASADADDIGVVRIWTDRDHASASVVRPDQRIGSRLPPPGGGGSGELELAGTYTGTGTVVATGFDDTDAAEPSLPAAVPFEAELWDDAGDVTLRLVDRYGALTSAGELIGTGTLTSEDGERFVGTIAFPAGVPFLEGSVGGQGFAAIAEPTAELELRAGAGLAYLTVTEALRGLGAPLTVTWTIVLARGGEPSGDPAPSVPAAVSLPYDEAARAASPTPWESAVASAFPSFASLDADARRARLGWIVGRDLELGACFEPTSFADARLLYLGLDPDDGFPTSTADWSGHPTFLRRVFYVYAGVNGRPAPVAARIVPGTVTLSGNWPAANEIPCAPGTFVGLMDGPEQNGTTWWYVANFGGVDFCEEVSEQLGCEVVDRTMGPSEVARFNAEVVVDVPNTSGGTYSQQLSLRADIRGRTRWCVLPDRPVACAQAASCAEVSTGSTPDTVTSGTWTTTAIGPVSGDALCESETRSAAVTIDRAADDGEDPRALDAFDGCLDELRRLDGAPPARSGAYGDALATLFVDGACLDAVRLLVSAQLGLRAPGAGDTASEARTYGARLLARWLRAHAFLASEAVQRDAMSAVFSTTPGRSTPPLEDVLEQSLAGWDLLLHPRSVAALHAQPADELADPDYRARRIHRTLGSADEQTIGLPVAILDALAHQASVAEALFERPAGAMPVESMRVLLPRLIAARALAFGLDARARTERPAHAWRARYDATERRLASTLGGALARARIVESGANPLGIEDDDLPLYFLDETTGPGGRFAAVSDFLLGTGAGTDAWAPTLVSQAADALEAARAAYVAQQDREYLAARDDRDYARWVDDVRYGYNTSLRDFCGPTSASLIDDPAFDAALCARNTADERCNIGEHEYYAMWTQADLDGRLCRHRLIDNRGNGRFTFTTTSALGITDQGVRGFLTACGTTRVTIGSCSSRGDRSCLRCGTSEHVLSAGALALVLPEASGTGGDEHLADLLGYVHDQCTAAHPTAREEPPMPRSVLEIPGCVRGSLGEAYLDVVSAQRTVESARAEYAEYLERYDIAIESCNTLASTTEQISMLRDAHTAKMDGLLWARQAADSVAAAAGTVKECLAGFSADPVKSGAMAGSCAAGAVEMVANVASIGLTSIMDRAQLAHDDAVADLEGASQVRICYNDARSELVGMRAASIAIEQATFDLDRATARVAQMVQQANLLWSEGHSWLAEIESNPVRSPSGELWADDLVRTYTRRFRLARRATYLAVRAVEYELQSSIALAGDVLAAETPDDLEAVLSDLWATSGTRTIGGSRPSELHVVISLRDDVLRLGDLSGVPAALRSSLLGLSVEERFHALLSAEAYATYDESGRYLGQRVPFTLAPLGALGIEPGAVPIYATSDCAERLWSVNASLIGEDLVHGRETSFVRMELHKANAFFSQWCGTAPEDEPFQVARVNPARNLFREPGAGDVVGGSAFGTDLAPSPFSRARVQAFLNVAREELEDPSYANGETSELAARGLFGEYAIFVPAELIARETASGGYTDGLVLDRVDDVLLRLDYVSVARP